MTRRPVPQSFRPAFERTLRLSRYVARVATARPAVVDELERRDARPFTREEMRAALAAQGESGATRLRRLRERGVVSLAHRGLKCPSPLGAGVAPLGPLSREAINAAAEEAQRLT